MCTIWRICNRCTGCIAMATLWKCVAEPSGIYQAHRTPHAARRTHYACRRRLPSPAIKSTRLLRVPLHFVHTAGCYNANAKCYRVHACTRFMPSYYCSCHFGRPFVKRFALCYRTVVCLSCLSLSVCLSVMLGNGQAVKWITMPLGTEIGLGPGLGPGHSETQLRLHRPPPQRKGA